MGLPSSCVSLSVRAMISDPGRLPASSLHNAVSVGFRSSYSVAPCFVTVTRLNLFSGGASSTYGPHGSRCTLTFCHSHFCFFQNANTWYGWLTIPYPAETFTLQETPSFAWRTRSHFGTFYDRNLARNMLFAALPTRKYYVTIDRPLLWGDCQAQE